MDFKVNVVKPGELQKAKDLPTSSTFTPPVQQRPVVNNTIANFNDVEKPRAREDTLDNISFKGRPDVAGDNYDIRKSSKNTIAPELLDSMYEELKETYHSLIRRKADLQGKYHGMVEENCKEIDKEIELAKNEYRVFCNIHNLPFR